MHVSAQYGESVGVADWFQSFCAVYHARAGAAGAEEATPSGKVPRRRRKSQQQSGSQVLPPPSATEALFPCHEGWHAVRTVAAMPTSWIQGTLTCWQVREHVSISGVAGVHHQVYAGEEARGAADAVSNHGERSRGVR